MRDVVPAPPAGEPAHGYEPRALPPEGAALRPRAAHRRPDARETDWTKETE
ncbi:hypothetical protein GCM10010182_30440 [Actinomadura cremea]|nr:hypothetical protein GCM10010182_30440 [Actinomadura cremea]